jgi:hypothetical protein
MIEMSLELLKRTPYLSAISREISGMALLKYVKLVDMPTV